jgi:MFS family permease
MERHRDTRGFIGRATQALTLYPALTVPAYRRLWMGIVPYHFAFQLSVLTTGYVAVTLSDSAFVVGVVVGAWGLPVLLVPPLGGVAADLYSRRRTLLLAQVVLGVSTLVIGVLALRGILAPWHLVVLGLTQGTTFAFFAPARTAYTASAVERGLVPNAIAAYSLSDYTSAVVAPVVGGFLLAVPTLGYGWVYVGIAGLYVVILAILLPLPYQAPASEEADASAGQRILEGLRYVRDTPPLPKLVAMAAISMFLGMPYLQLMPLFANRVFDVGSAGLGLLLAASGVGAVAGTLAAARLRGDRQVVRWQPVLGVGLGVTVVLFAVSPGFPVALATAAVAGFASSAFAIVNYSLVIRATEPRLYGRVASIYQLTFAFGPLGAIPVAALADRVGAPTAVAFGGVLLVAAFVAMTRGLGLRGRAPLGP